MNSLPNANGFMERCVHECAIYGGAIRASVDGKDICSPLGATKNFQKIFKGGVRMMIQDHSREITSLILKDMQ